MERKQSDPRNVSIQNIEPPLDGSMIAYPAREDHPGPLLKPMKNCSPYIFLVDIKLALGNNPHLFSVFSWNLHVAYVIRLQYFVAQR